MFYKFMPSKIRVKGPMASAVVTDLLKKITSVLGKFDLKNLKTKHK